MGNDAVSYKGLIRTYIDKCETTREPLSGRQIGILEQTIVEVLEAPRKHIVKESEDTYNNRLDRMAIEQAGKLSRYQRTQRLINAIKAYHHGSTDPDIDVTDGDAIALYNFIAEEVKHRNISEIKKKYYLPGGFGWGSLRTLHKYLQIKGFLGPLEEAPRQPKHQF